ncbi:hypothetical protein F383_33839 [Gossypium arboreum]|uniref:Uncharacterized protein n=1 Tax=Gossypium arboreum TaxID=29729 RepID=A0A0B0PNP9_GOSAR|nr:hypothetical protein F383_33839 [Gossypium arboreum]
MVIHTAEVIHLMHQLLAPYLIEFKVLLTSQCTSHAYIVRHLLKIYVCHTMNVTSELIHKQIQDLFCLGLV